MCVRAEAIKKSRLSGCRADEILNDAARLPGAVLTESWGSGLVTGAAFQQGSCICDPEVLGRELLARTAYE